MRHLWSTSSVLSLSVALGSVVPLSADLDQLWLLEDDRVYADMRGLPEGEMIVLRGHSRLVKFSSTGAYLSTRRVPCADGDPPSTRFQDAMIRLVGEDERSLAPPPRARCLVTPRHASAARLRRAPDGAAG